MNKPQLVLRSIFAVVTAFSFVFIFVGSAYADSTIGTNMSTTGILIVAPASDSATSVRFQNAAGTNYFIADSTNRRIGIGAAPGTTFEVQGTASASYFLTGNTIQVGGFASVAYNRFGTNATTYANDLTTTNDVLISGNLEVDLKSYFDAPGEFQGTASASYFLTGNTIQVGGFASVAYSRFGTTATTHVGTIAGTADLMVGGGFEVDGSAAFDGFAKFGGKASVSGNFQTSGRFIADTAASHSFKGNLNVTKTVVVGSATASGSGAYVAEFVGATNGTASFYFGGPSAATLGSCFQLKSTTGAWIYMRFRQGDTSPLLSTIRCE